MISLLLSTVFLALPTPFQQAAVLEEPRQLAPGEPIADDLETGESHDYVIEAGPEHFVSGSVNQKTVDVVIRVYGPSDQMIEEFDGPGEGPEPFTFETKVAGRYRIEVSPFEEEVGDYSISLQLVQPVAKTGPGRVDQLMSSYTIPGTPGGVITVLRGDQVLFEKAYGMANLVHDVPFRIETPSNLGSTSKQFTAFAICLLEAQGELSLDDEVRKYLRKIPKFEESVTLRHLLTHTSGYREFLNTLGLAGRRLDKGDYIGREEIMAMIERQPKLQNSPGAEFNYNNTGYSLLTSVIEKVTGETFPEWLRVNVFEPLGMKNTIVRTEPDRLIHGSAQGYAPGEGGWIDSRDLGGAMGAGAIYSTVGDMAKWIRNLQTGELGGMALIEEMMTSNFLTSGKETGYGFGLMIDEQNGVRRVHHGGADSAHRAMMMTYPDLEAGVVALSNNASFNSSGISAQVAEAFFAELVKEDASAESEIVEASAEAGEAFDPAAYDLDLYDEIAGRYELDEAPGFILEFTREERRFMTQATGQPNLTIVPISELSFKLVDVEASVTFLRGEDGTISGAMLHQNGDHPATRLTGERWKPSKDELEKYEGRYFSDELEAFYTIVRKGRSLRAQHRRMEDMKLKPTEEHGFVTDSDVQLAFDVDDAGVAQSFTVSEGRTRGIQFRRFSE